MACRGVHFALTADQAERLLTLSDDDEVLTYIQEELEEQWDNDWLQETDKAWDAIHRCLTMGTTATASRVLAKCVLGGRQLYSGGDYIVSFLSPADVEALAAGLQPLDETWIRETYRKLDPEDYGVGLSQDDEDYTVAYFIELKEFFSKSAAQRRAVVFTVDQ